MNCNPGMFAPAKFAAAIAGMSVLLAIYAFVTASSWRHANPSAPSPSQQVEPNPAAR
jgi:hypothetical protein